MPGLRLTVRQAARLFGMAPDVADAVLDELQRASILARSSDGLFALIADPSLSGCEPSGPRERGSSKHHRARNTMTV